MSEEAYQKHGQERNPPHIHEQFAGHYIQLDAGPARCFFVDYVNAQ